MVRIAFICAFLLLTGCASGGSTSDPRPIPAAWTGDVEAVGDGEQGGFATVTVLPDGGTRANLTLRGGTPEGAHAWHIHAGDCGDEPDDSAESVGPADAYPLLEPDSRGNASGTVSLATSLVPDEKYHIDVHRSLDDPTILACGNLILAD